MYLIEIDSSTGLAKWKTQHDGIMVIPEFRALINNQEFGIECFTAVSLVVDWLSPIRHYSLSDRPKRAMYEVSNNRSAFAWGSELVQKALNKYSELQYNPSLVEKERLDNILMDKLNEIKDEKNSKKQIDLFKQLNTIKHRLVLI